MEEIKLTQIIESVVFDVRKKMNAVKYLKESKNSENETSIEIFNNMLILFERLLWESLITSTCLLFEKNWYVKNGKRKKKEKTRSLYWYIEEKKEEFSSLTSQYDSLLNEFDIYNNELNRLRKVRDKLIAHRDSEADFETEFLRDVELKIEDVEKLVVLSEQITQLDIEKIDATRGYGINKLFDLINLLEKESPEFNSIISKYRFK